MKRLNRFLKGFPVTPEPKAFTVARNHLALVISKEGTSCQNALAGMDTIELTGSLQIIRMRRRFL